MLVGCSRVSKVVLGRAMGRAWYGVSDTAMISTSPVCIGTFLMLRGCGYLVPMKSRAAQVFFDHLHARFFPQRKNLRFRRNFSISHPWLLIQRP